MRLAFPSVMAIATQNSKLPVLRLRLGLAHFPNAFQQTENDKLPVPGQPWRTECDGLKFIKLQVLELNVQPSYGVRYPIAH